MIRASRASLAAATLLIASAAIYNGYPLVHSDTGTYLYGSFKIREPSPLPIFYSAFLLLTHLRLTLWGAVLAQSAITALLVREVLRGVSAGARTDLALVVVAAALGIGTAVPWFQGQIMPDALTGIGSLCLYLTISRTFPERRARWGIAGVLVLSLTAHPTHLPVALGVTSLAQIALLSCPRRARPRWRFRRAWGCIGIAVVLIPAVNYLPTGEIFFARATYPYVLGRLVEDGIAKRLLDDRCAAADYALCLHREDLEHMDAQTFLWHPESPLGRIGGWDGETSRQEARRIVLDSLAAYPLEHLSALVTRSIEQLFRVGTGEGLSPYPEGHWIDSVVGGRFRREHAHYLASRQQRGQLPLQQLTALHQWVLAMSATSSLAILVAGLRARGAPGLGLHAFVWLSLVVNAAVAAALLGVSDRFQARVAWLLPLAVLATFWGLVAARIGPAEAAPSPIASARRWRPPVSVGRLVLALVTGLGLSSLLLAIVASQRVVPRFAGPVGAAARGAYHVHSDLSHDSQLSLEEIAQAAKLAGLDFVVLTDHDTQLPHLRSIDGVTLIPGAELSTRAGHLVVVGATELPSADVGEITSLYSAVGAAGGASMIAHPSDDGGGDVWRGPITGAHGLEIANFASSTSRRGGLLYSGLWPTALLWPFHRDLALVQLYDRDEEALAIWDGRADPSFVGVCAVDAHGVIDLRPSLEAWALVLNDPLPAEPERRAADALRQIVEGRFHCRAATFGLGGSFEFYAVQSDGGRSKPGDPSPGFDLQRLEVEGPVASAGTTSISLRRDGEEVARTVGSRLTYADPKPGTYRVEVEIDRPGIVSLGPSPIPVIYSGRIRVTDPRSGDSSTSTTPRPQGRVGDGQNSP